MSADAVPHDDADTDDDTDGEAEYESLVSAEPESVALVDCDLLASAEGVMLVDCTGVNDGSGDDDNESDTFWVTARANIINSTSSESEPMPI